MPLASYFSGRYTSFYDGLGTDDFSLESLEFVFLLGKNGLVDEALDFIGRLKEYNYTDDRDISMHRLMKVYLGVGAKNHDL